MGKLADLLKKSHKALKSNIEAWAGENAEDFLNWDATPDQAKHIVDEIGYDEWSKWLQPHKAASLKPGLDSTEDVRETLEQLKVKVKNVKLQSQKPIKEYDPSTYTSPGRLLGKWDVDMERVRQVHALTAGEMEAEDKKYEAAQWELSSESGNDWTDNKEGKASRERIKKEATEKMTELIDRYEKLEVEKQREDQKAGKIEDIKSAVELLLPGTFSGNALCMKLWELAKLSAGSGGAYHLKEGFTAGELRAAWAAWAALQAISSVKGFESWRVGNGTAQDKSERSDINSRPHTRQMNFAVKWRGTLQMIHVGLTGYENPNCT